MSAKRTYAILIIILILTCTIIAYSDVPIVPEGYYIEPYITGFANVNAIAFSPGGEFGYEGQLIAADSRPDPGTIYTVPQKGEKIFFVKFCR